MTASRSELDILDIAQRFGAKLRRVTAVEFVGRCPECGGDDRFAVNVAKGVFNCRGFGGGGVVELARHVGGMSLGEALAFAGIERTDTAPRRAREGRWQAPAQVASDSNRDVALALWRRRRPIGGTLAERYIREARGYSGVILATLAILPAAGEHSPAMIAAYALASEPEPGVLAICDDNVRAVHLTRLLPDGTKLDKRTIGRGAAGSPIVIAPPNDLLGLAITEGIEDALSVHAATGLGAWAAGCAGRMPALADAVPSYIERVTVIADADSDGQRYAHRLAERLTERRIAAAIKTLRRPHETG